jgi:hypothetical protein
VTALLAHFGDLPEIPPAVLSWVAVGIANALFFYASKIEAKKK